LSKPDSRTKVEATVMELFCRPGLGFAQRRCLGGRGAVLLANRHSGGYDMNVAVT